MWEPTGAVGELQEPGHAGRFAKDESIPHFRQASDRKVNLDLYLTSSSLWSLPCSSFSQELMPSPITWNQPGSR